MVINKYRFFLLPVESFSIFTDILNPVAVVFDGFSKTTWELCQNHLSKVSLIRVYRYGSYEDSEYLGSHLLVPWGFRKAIKNYTRRG
jgi:hypothetical protein